MKKKLNVGTYSSEDVLSILREHGKGELDRRIAAAAAGREPPRRRLTLPVPARAAMLLFAVGFLGLGSASVLRSIGFRRMIVTETEYFVAARVVPRGNKSYFEGFEREMRNLLNTALPLGNSAGGLESWGEMLQEPAEE